MKIHSLALSVVVLAAGNSHAFVPQNPSNGKAPTALQAQKGHDWFGPAAAAAAGWAMAAQLAFAAPADSAFTTMLPGEFLVLLLSLVVVVVVVVLCCMRDCVLADARRI